MVTVQGMGTLTWRGTQEQDDRQTDRRRGGGGVSWNEGRVNNLGKYAAASQR